MDRRQFMATGVATGAALTLGASEVKAGASNKAKFRMKYGPHFGMFSQSAGSSTRGRKLSAEDATRELRFAADQGFTAWEDNGMMSRPVEVQKRIAKTMTDLDITMGVFVCGFGLNNVTFVKPPSEVKDEFVAGMKKAVEVAKRVNAKWTTLVPGAYVKNVEWDYQTANVIENLKYCAEVCEPAGLIMVLEPLNWWANHPGVFLSKIPQAYLVCKGVNSPSVKILDDLYHQQITEGNLIPNMDAAWDEIAYFQMGDNPGRKEPTTGEINYRNIFKHIHKKGFTGVLGMEHGNSKKGVEGEQAVIDAYRWCDNF